MPECRNGLCQDIPSASEIGIARVIAGDTSEHLSLAVAPVLLTTCGACPGGASRIDSNRPHTVLRRQTFNPLSHLPICPRGGGFAEVLASRFGFAFLQADQVFEANSLKAIPGQLFNCAINVTITCDSTAPFAFTAGARFIRANGAGHPTETHTNETTTLSEPRACLPSFAVMAYQTERLTVSEASTYGA